MPLQLSESGALRQLLMQLFKPKETLEVYILDFYEELHPSIDFKNPADIVAGQIAVVMRSQGYVDNEFFDDLVERDAGANKSDIEAVRTRFFPTHAQGVDPIDTPRAAARDFVDRSGIRKLAQDMLMGQGERVTLIKGGEKSGKTHCKYLFSHLASTTKTFRTWVFDFERWSRSGRVTPELISQQLAGKMELDLPYGDGHGQIARETLKWLETFDTKTRNLKQTWCLFFDSLHKVDVPPETREFVESLALYVSEYPDLPVRIVIAGVEAEKLETDELRSIVSERPMRTFQRADGEAWIRAVAKSDGLTLDEAKLQQELNHLFPNGQSTQAPKEATEALRKVIETVIGEQR